MDPIQRIKVSEYEQVVKHETRLSIVKVPGYLNGILGSGKTGGVLSI